MAGEETRVYPVEFTEQANVSNSLASIPTIPFIHETYEEGPLTANITIGGLSVGSAQMLTSTTFSQNIGNTSLYPNT